jgi:hypothetical protein
VAALLEMFSDDQDEIDISHEGQIAQLQEALQFIQNGNPFKVGDLVTPRKNAPIKFGGIPHLIVGVNSEGFPCGVIEHGMSGSAETYDLWIISIAQSGHISSHTVPSWQMQPYIAE